MANRSRFTAGKRDREQAKREKRERKQQKRLAAATARTESSAEAHSQTGMDERAVEPRSGTGRAD